MVETIALILLLGVLDRLRGDTMDLLGIDTSNYRFEWFGVEFGISTDRIAYSWVIAVLAGYGSLLDPITWLIMMGMFIGMGFGWGEPLGSYLYDRPMNQNNLEKWQFSIFKRRADLALVLRGALWGICIAPAAYFDPKLWIVFAAYTFALFAGAYIAKHIYRPEAWPIAETLRGWIAGVIISSIYW